MSERVLRFLQSVSVWVAFACAALLVASPASAQTFFLQSTPDNFTGIYADSAGNTITLELEPENTNCAQIDAAGRVELYARSSISACDRTIELRFTTSGINISSITFNDVDDMDGTAPRDAFAANVAGTWTSPTVEVHSFAAPPAYADQIARLTSAGAVGSFIANDAGENPNNEMATFTLATPTNTFSILFDDAQGGRDARVLLGLSFIQVTTPPPGGGIPTIGCIDFESGLSGFTRSNTTFVGVGSQTSNSGSQSLFLRHRAATATSPVIGTANLSAVSVWIRRGADSFSENPESGEDLIIEGLTSGGAWVQLGQLPGGGSPGEIFDLDLPLPASMQHAGFQIRFRNTGGSGNDFDYWHVDDVCTVSLSAAELDVTKVSFVISDPVNGATNPKAIPGALVEYLITVSNIGDGAVFTDTTIVTDDLPGDVKMCLTDLGGAGPVLFQEPSASTALTYSFTALGDGGDDLSFSNDDGASFAYTPAADSDGCDAAISQLRVNPKGAFAPSSSFTLRLRVRIQ